MVTYRRCFHLAGRRAGKRQRCGAMEFRGIARSSGFPHWSTDGRPGELPPGLDFQCSGENVRHEDGSDVWDFDRLSLGSARPR